MCVRVLELLGVLVTEAGLGEDDANEKGGPPLPVEWVVDIADKDNDWFVATAYGYNDIEQTVHVMVPDRDAPTWSGDVALNPLVRLICRTSALYRQPSFRSDASAFLRQPMLAATVKSGRYAQRWIDCCGYVILVML